MNEGQIWWTQIGNSLEIVRKVTNYLQESVSAVLWAPDALPWRQTFYRMVNLRRSEYASDRQLRRVKWVNGTEPGKFLMEHVCFEPEIMDYWFGDSRAEYLADKEELSLSETDVWVTGIQSQDDLFRWTQFVGEYQRAGKPEKQKAVFLLEYTGPEMETPNLRQLSYRVESYDCRVFCLEAASELNSAELRSYQAELALWIGNGDPERCAALLNAGQKLLENPLEIANKQMKTAVNSEGIPFAPMSDKQIMSGIWKTGIVLLYPILEEFQLEFIASHEAELACHLPIRNCNGDEIRDPYDLEWGNMDYIVSSHPNAFTTEDARKVCEFRKIRNQLAHNKPLEYADVKMVLEL